MTGLRVLLSRAAAVLAVAASGHASCAPQTHVVVDLDHALRAIEPSFFGFNLEWIPFQASAYTTSGSLHPELLAKLKVFQGAFYRYPGGTAANFFDWRQSVGPVSDRAPQRVPWGGRIRATFGPDEYLDFVKAVGGQPWYVVNLSAAMGCRGPKGAEEDCMRATAGAAAELAAHLHSREARLPSLPGDAASCRLGAACQIGIWELGNETDHGSRPLGSGEYGKISRRVMDAIRGENGKARFVAHTATAPWSSSLNGNQRFTAEVLRDLTPLGVDFSYHLYFDGIPTSKAVSFLSSGTGNQPSASGQWVTEYGRWPDRNPYTTRFTVAEGPTNHDAAISIADFLLKLTRRTSVRGAMAHALAGAGPWPMFYKDPADGRFRTTPVFDVLTLLRTHIVGTSLSTQASGADQFEVQAFRRDDDGAVTIVIVNRDRSDKTVEVNIRGARGVALDTRRMCTLTAARGIRCSDIQDQPTFTIVKSKEGAGRFNATVEARAVAIFEFR